MFHVGKNKFLPWTLSLPCLLGLAFDKKEQNTWQSSETAVRNIANYRWNCNAVAETISGIKCDCILKPGADHWIAIEITEERDLQKVRADILKLRTIKYSLMNEDIYCQCYMVMKDIPTDSMRQSGESQKIKVVSLQEFQKEYFDYNSYLHIRSQKLFGSLINIDTGEPKKNI